MSDLGRRLILMDLLLARVQYLERLIPDEACNGTVLSQIKSLQDALEPFAGKFNAFIKETLKRFDALDHSKKLKEIQMLDIDLQTLFELEKYIKITNLRDDAGVKNSMCELQNSKVHYDINTIDQHFWKLVDSYAEMVIIVQ